MGTVLIASGIQKKEPGRGTGPGGRQTPSHSFSRTSKFFACFYESIKNVGKRGDFTRLVEISEQILSPLGRDGREGEVLEN